LYSLTDEEIKIVERNRKKNAVKIWRYLLLFVSLYNQFCKAVTFSREAVAFSREAVAFSREAVTFYFSLLPSPLSLLISHYG